MNVEIKIVKGLEKPYAVLYTSQLNEEIKGSFYVGNNQ